MENKKQKPAQEPQSEKRNRSEPRKERPSEDTKKTRHVDEVRREKPSEELKRHGGGDDAKRDKHREEKPISTFQRERPTSEAQKEKAADVHRPIFERRGVLDSSVLYPTRFPSPPRPARPPPPVKRPSVDAKRDRKDGKDSSSRPPRPSPASPQAKRPSVEVKKERKAPADPNAPVARTPFLLHPPPQRSGSVRSPACSVVTFTLVMLRDVSLV
ncbi:serine/arginine repetitive matrix protein 1-like isoform X2 [Salarias fasciatus]|uniref:serine/arginine repetitive matrix protein 1-like isoform X2 n=1 Tax=Salarias fasciatus TaxID=181472 RepID=UPI001176F448|nr:serine/arginine repetitive matrix protein 1-like isoform X2 [Salarias fasciatus]